MERDVAVFAAVLFFAVGSLCGLAVVAGGTRFVVSLPYGVAVIAAIVVLAVARLRMVVGMMIGSSL